MLYVRGSSAAVITSQTINNNAQQTGVVDNTSALELWDQVEAIVTMGTSVTTGAPWVLYLVPHSTNDSNAGDVLTPPQSVYVVAQWPANSGTAAQRFTMHGISIPPGQFTYVLSNQTGQNSSATSCTLNRRPYHVA